MTCIPIVSRLECLGSGPQRSGQHAAIPFIYQVTLNSARIERSLPRAMWSSYLFRRQNDADGYYRNTFMRRR
ncbi:hypothetical protein E2C01_100427 [Portunus trituberculatus]|uniref:Uncharacterized protein n=1 Tax=Portunus trituberculatus TaxID=210409 RepID=A0A5B7K2Z9_PORTR|nr:hypothetical protein [Portunus trituberculatus]